MSRQNGITWKWISTNEPLHEILYTKILNIIVRRSEITPLFWILKRHVTKWIRGSCRFHCISKIWIIVSWCRWLPFGDIVSSSFDPPLVTEKDCAPHHEYYQYNYKYNSYGFIRCFLRSCHCRNGVVSNYRN